MSRRGTATHCPHGHERTPENTYVQKGGRTYCRPCKLLRQRRYEATEAGRATGRRYRGTDGQPARRGTATHCPHGHERTPENTYVHAVQGATCRVCRRLRARAAYVPKRAPKGLVCAIPDCDRRPYGHLTWCQKHYNQWRRTGDPIPKKRETERAGYAAVHKRLSRSKGKASTYACVDCGQAAAVWSLNWRLVPLERLVFATSGQYKGHPFSHEADDYSPRCMPCGQSYDVAFPYRLTSAAA